MLSCLRSLPPPSMANNYFSSPTSPGYSADNTPTSSVQLSPTVNLTQEYTLALQTNSYGEIRRTFDQCSFFYQNGTIDQVEFCEEPQLLEQVLQPSRECVQEALSLIKPNSLTDLVTSYFEHSERTSRLCLLLYSSFHRACRLYAPIHSLLDDLPLELNSDSYSLSHAECTLAFNLFLQFDRLENPFIPESNNFDDIRLCFSQLRQQLDRHLRKSQSRVHLIRHCSTGSALCIIAAGVGVAISAVAIATHSLVALVASPICPAILPSFLTKKEMVHLDQLDAAAKGAYVLHNDLDTITCLVTHLHNVVENDKLLIHRLGVERGMDWYPIQEVLKQLQRNRSKFIQQLESLEDHLFLCFAAINRARSLLLQEIHLHQNCHPG